MRLLKSSENFMVRRTQNTHLSETMGLALGVLRYFLNSFSMWINGPTRLAPGTIFFNSHKTEPGAMLSVCSKEGFPLSTINVSKTDVKQYGVSYAAALFRAERLPTENPA